MAAATNFSGIASGIDTNALIDAELASKRATRITPLTDKVTELNDTTTALQLLQTKVSALQAKLRTFSSLSSGAVVKNGVSSDETVSTATVSNGTSNGSYTITVNPIASSAKMVIPPGTGFPSNTTSLGFGSNETLSFTVGTTPISVPVTTTTTASQFVDAFNTATAGTAKAVLVNVGPTGGAAEYKILITNQKTGETAGALGLTPPTDTPTFTASVTPSSDATISVDGLGTQIKRSSNIVADIIPGITFNIKATGTSTITVQNDVASTMTSIKEFVKLYNDVITTINDNNTVTRDESSSDVKNVFGVLAKTSTDDSILSGLRSALSSIAYKLTGTDGGPTNNVVNFSSMGITTDAGTYDTDTKTGGGTLKFTEDDSGGIQGFVTAVTNEPDSVNQLLTKFADLVSLTQTGGNLLDTYVRAGGNLDISITSNQTQVRDMNLRIATLESALANEETSLRARYASFEALTGRLQQQASGLTSALSGLK